jgi:hypothetical protein
MSVLGNPLVLSNILVCNMDLAQLHIFGVVGRLISQSISGRQKKRPLVSVGFLNTFK